MLRFLWHMSPIMSWLATKTNYPWLGFINCFCTYSVWAIQDIRLCRSYSKLSHQWTHDIFLCISYLILFHKAIYSPKYSRVLDRHKGMFIDFFGIFLGGTIMFWSLCLDDFRYYPSVLYLLSFKLYNHKIECIFGRYFSYLLSKG